MAFDFNDSFMINLLEAGDVLEVVTGSGAFIVQIKEGDLTRRGKAQLRSAQHMEDRKIRLGKLEELEDFVMVKDNEVVYTRPDPSKGDTWQGTSKIPDYVYGSTFACNARALKADDPERKFYKFI